MDEKSKISNISDKQQSQKQMNQSSENICVADNDNNNVIDIDDDDNNNQQQTNEQHPVSNNENNNFESFKKNAVHVNDLENHWHQEVVVASKKNFTINDNMNQNQNRSIKNLPKNVTTNIIMDDKIFSSSSSYKSNDKQSKQQKMCFINCLSKYNVCLQDTAELNVNNFTNLVNFIYTRK